MPTATRRLFNFSAGPAVLPESVLEEVQRDLMALPGVGMSVLEISHRSTTYDEIAEAAEADLRALAGIPDNYRVLFLQGGASLQFAMVPLNLLPPDGVADYIVTGVWSKKALAEAARVGTARVAASTEDAKFTRLPRQDELQLTPGAAYVHMTSNNTIHGTQWRQPPDVGDAPLVCDACSDILSAPIDITRYGLVYAGAQKNLAPAGLTVAIVRDDLVSRSPASLPTMLQYSVHAANASHYNTPPVFAIYIMRLVLQWLRHEGGLDAIAVRNERKAATLYAAIDRTDFYRGTAERAARSRMNVTFRLPTDDLDARFLKSARAADLDGLKGHRAAGGIRASLYNAFPEAGVVALVQFMQEFERTQG